MGCLRPARSGGARSSRTPRGSAATKPRSCSTMPADVSVALHRSTGSSRSSRRSKCHRADQWLRIRLRPQASRPTRSSDASRCRSASMEPCPPTSQQPSPRMINPGRATPSVRPMTWPRRRPGRPSPRQSCPAHLRAAGSRRACCAGLTRAFRRFHALSFVGWATCSGSWPTACEAPGRGREWLRSPSRHWRLWCWSPELSRRRLGTQPEAARG
jgi:hypothetical protein